MENQEKENYKNTIETLDGWIKDYIKDVCVSLEPDVIELYLENDSDSAKEKEGYEKHKLKQNNIELKWGFFIKNSMATESLITILNIYLEVLEKKLPSKKALEEYKEILNYAKRNTGGLKKQFFKEVVGERMVQCYVERVMKALPDKEMFVELSALNYENRVTHTHLIFNMNMPFDDLIKSGIAFAQQMEFDLQKLRLIRKLMELSGETLGLFIQKDPSLEIEKWYIEGVVQLDKVKDCYQVEMIGHSIWGLKHGDELLFRYKEGVYKLPFIGNKKNEYDKEFEKLNSVICDANQCNIIREVLDKIRKIASHGTGLVFLDNSLMKTEIKRLAGFGKAYAIKSPALNLQNVSIEILKGITAIDGAIFCNFELECKAIGVIVDGETVSEGDPGRGARYNSLANYVRWLKKDEKNKNKNCIAVVMSEDGPINIIVS